MEGGTSLVAEKRKNDETTVHEGGYCKRVKAEWQANVEDLENNYVTLLHLSDDVLLHIFTYCTPTDIRALSFCNRRLNVLCSDRSLWRRVDLRDRRMGVKALSLYVRSLPRHTTQALCVRGLVGRPNTYHFQSKKDKKKSREDDDSKCATKSTSSPEFTTNIKQSGSNTDDVQNSLTNTESCVKNTHTSDSTNDLFGCKTESGSDPASIPTGVENSGASTSNSYHSKKCSENDVMSASGHFGYAPVTRKGRDDTQPGTSGQRAGSNDPEMADGDDEGMSDAYNVVKESGNSSPKPFSPNYDSQVPTSSPSSSASHANVEKKDSKGDATKKQMGGKFGNIEAEEDWTVTKDLMNAIRKKCPDLKELRLEFCYIDCNAIQSSSFPSTLETLSLRGSVCRNVPLSRAYLFRLHEHCPKLTDIDLSRCGWLASHSLLVLSKVPTLKRLSLKHCWGLGECVAYASLSARYGFKSLEVLDIRGTPMGDSEITAFSLIGPLKELLLQGSGVVEDSAISGSFGGYASNSPPLRSKHDTGEPLTWETQEPSECHEWGWSSESDGEGEAEQQQEEGAGGDDQHLGDPANPLAQVGEEGIDPFEAVGRVHVIYVDVRRAPHNNMLRVRYAPVHQPPVQAPHQQQLNDQEELPPQPGIEVQINNPEEGDRDDANAFPEVVIHREGDNRINLHVQYGNDDVVNIQPPPQFDVNHAHGGDERRDDNQQEPQLERDDEHHHHHHHHHHVPHGHFLPQEILRHIQRHERELRRRYRENHRADAADQNPQANQPEAPHNVEDRDAVDAPVREREGEEGNENLQGHVNNEDGNNDNVANHQADDNVVRPPANIVNQPVNNDNQLPNNGNQPANIGVRQNVGNLNPPRPLARPGEFLRRGPAFVLYPNEQQANRIIQQQQQAQVVHRRDVVPQLLYDFRHTMRQLENYVGKFRTTERYDRYVRRIHFFRRMLQQIYNNEPVFNVNRAIPEQPLAALRDVVRIRRFIDTTCHHLERLIARAIQYPPDEVPFRINYNYIDNPDYVQGIGEDENDARMRPETVEFYIQRFFGVPPAEEVNVDLRNVERQPENMPQQLNEPVLRIFDRNVAAAEEIVDIVNNIHNVLHNDRVENAPPQQNAALHNNQEINNEQHGDDGGRMVNIRNINIEIREHNVQVPIIPPGEGNQGEQNIAAHRHIDEHIERMVHDEIRAMQQEHQQRRNRHDPRAPGQDERIRIEGPFVIRGDVMEEGGRRRRRVVHIPLQLNLRGAGQPSDVNYVGTSNLVTDASLLRFGVSKNIVHIGGDAQLQQQSATRGGQLTTLVCRGYPRVTDRALSHLAAAAPRLSRLDFSHTGVTLAGAQAFRAARQDCELIVEHLQDIVDGEEDIV